MLSKNTSAMEILKSSITLHDIRLYAFHGVLPQERTVGGWYIVSVTVDYPYSGALESDSVNDTLNYAEVLEIVQQEMAIPSNLLEHVAGRIVKALFNRFEQIEEIQILLTKECPPMGGNTAGASVELKVRK